MSSEKLLPRLVHYDTPSCMMKEANSFIAYWGWRLNRRIPLETAVWTVTHIEYSGIKEFRTVSKKLKKQFGDLINLDAAREII